MMNWHELLEALPFILMAVAALAFAVAYENMEKRYNEAVNAIKAGEAH